MHTRLFVLLREKSTTKTNSRLANFNIREHALGVGDDVLMLPIVSPDEGEQIGLLKVQQSCSYKLAIRSNL